MCRGKVPTADNQVDEIQDVLINIQNRLDSISDKAKRGDKALKQLNGDETYKSIKRMLLDLENRIEALEDAKNDESETEPSDQ